MLFQLIKLIILLIIFFIIFRLLSFDLYMHHLLNHFTKNNTEFQLLEDIEWLKIIEQGFTINTPTGFEKWKEVLIY